jgi:pimeloyl-ACP methyl ester carboxylesterase
MGCEIPKATMPSFTLSDGATLAYGDSGGDDWTIVLIHGWQADRRVWEDVIAALGSGVRVIAVDLRGSGASSEAGGPYTLERYAQDTRELIDGLEIAPAVVAGHSMGATVALRLAVDAPQSVRAMVLVAPVPASGGGYSPKGEAYLRSTAGDPAKVQAWLARTFAAEPDEATLAPLCAAAALTARDTALESFESWAHADFAEETRTIRTPVVVAAPEKDAPESVDERVAALLPNARFVVLPGCAHYAILERPGAIAELIREVCRQ